MAQAAELDSPPPTLTLPPALRARVGRVQAILKAGEVAITAPRAEVFQPADGQSLLDAAGFILNNTAAYATDPRIAEALRAIGDAARSASRMNEQGVHLAAIRVLRLELVNLVEGA